MWALIDDEICSAAARAGLAALALSGCSASTDHHYVFPRDAGDLLEVEIDAAASIGLRFHPCRGSMDLGHSDGGLPPDEVVEDRDAILAASEAAISRFHDPAPGAMVRIALAPCSPFSVTRGLMTDTAELARRRGRAAAHASRRDARRGAVLSGAVRHAPGRLPRRARLAGRRRLARALCAPQRRRDRPLRRHRHRRRSLPELERAARRGDRTGGGPDQAPASPSASASTAPPQTRTAGSRPRCARRCSSPACAAGPQAMTARQALARATIDGARCLGRDDELGSLEVGQARRRRALAPRRARRRGHR